MKIIEPSVEIIAALPAEDAYNLIERAGRTCYKSDMSDDPVKFIKRIIKRGHMSVIEHVNVSVKFVCDRGVTHELVRHRLCSFSQESSRYCNYSKDKFGNEITVIRPCFWDDYSKEIDNWCDCMSMLERVYFNLLKAGAKPEEARSVLPNSLKTEIIVTANLREWMHIFELRLSEKAHPQMRQIVRMAHDLFIALYPGIFKEECSID